MSLFFELIQVAISHLESLFQVSYSVEWSVPRQVIFSGGGYFRLAPYWLLHKWSREAAEAQICPIRVTEEISRNEGYLLSYIHPRDLDGGQPMLEGLPTARKFKSYVGLKQAPEKLLKYLKDFKFVDVQIASDMIAWDRVPRIEL